MMGDDEPAHGTEHWDEAELFGYIKQSYLMSARWLQTLLLSGRDLDRAEIKRIDAYTEGMIEALNPADFFAANRDLLDATIEAEGDNLVKGLGHMLAEFDRIKQSLTPRGTSEAPAGTPGRNRVPQPLDRTSPFRTGHHRGA